MHLRAVEVAAVDTVEVAASAVDTPAGWAEALIWAAGSVALAASAAALTSAALARAISPVLAAGSLAALRVSTSPRLAATSPMKGISVTAGASCRVSMATTTGATTRITHPTTAAIRGRIDRRRAGSRRCPKNGPSRAGALGCNQVVKRVDLSVQHVETAFAAGAVLAQGSDLARLH